MELEVGMRLRSKTSHRLGTVKEINTKWAWFTMEWDKKRRGDKSVIDTDDVFLYFTVVSTKTKNIERADSFLKRANNGLDDHWREYD